MIDDLSFSARAEKRSHLLDRPFATVTLAGSMAAALMILPASAWGIDDVGKAQQAVESMPLRPQPDAVPWLRWNNGVKIDTLMTPRFDPSGVKLLSEGRDSPLQAIS